MFQHNYFPTKTSRSTNSKRGKCTALCGRIQETTETSNNQIQNSDLDIWTEHDRIEWEQAQINKEVHWYTKSAEM